MKKVAGDTLANGFLKHGHEVMRGSREPAKLDSWRERAGENAHTADFGGVKPKMFICGNDEGAKKETRAVLDAFGWETEDMGAVEAARAIEPLCVLGCIPGFRRNSWGHAFKLLQ